MGSPQNRVTRGDRPRAWCLLLLLLLDANETLHVGDHPELDIVGAKGGGGVAVFNQEIRFPLWWRFRGVAFYDAGNAFETASDISFSDLRQSAGAGLRFELPFGLVRLDWAAVIDPLPGETPWRLLFSLGDAF